MCALFRGLSPYIIPRHAKNVNPLTKRQKENPPRGGLMMGLNQSMLIQPL